MCEYLKLLLSIKNISISKDCIKIIIEYFHFNLEYVEKILIEDIKSSKYIEDFDIILKDNIDILIEKKNMIDFLLTSDKLIIIASRKLEFYKNNFQIKERNLKAGICYRTTYQNDNIFICNSHEDNIKIISTDNRKPKFWSINGKNYYKKYGGCLSITSNDNKIYVVTYEKQTCYHKKIHYQYYINIYDNHGLLLKNSKILKNLTLYVHDFRLIISNNMIFLLFVISNSINNNILQVYNTDIDLMYENTKIFNDIDCYPYVKIISTKDNIIIMCNEYFYIYKYEKIK